MPRPEWFSGARLNYAADTVGSDKDTNAIAIVARSQSRGPVAVNFGELRDQVARARVGLQRLGIGPGARVAACLPNIPETLVALLATASRGAVRATCAPEFGPRSVLDHLGRLEPTLLLALAGYRWGDRLVDRRDRIAVRAGLPSLRAVVHVPCADGNCNALPDMTARGELSAEPGPPEFDPAAFAYPGCALTISAWVMWHALVSALLTRCSIVMIDRNPIWPGGVPERRQRRVRPLHRDRPGLSAASGLGRRDVGAMRGRRCRRVQRPRPRGHWPAGELVIRCPMLPSTPARFWNDPDHPSDPAHDDWQEARAPRQAHRHRRPVATVVSRGALVSPASIEPFTAYAAQHATPSEKGERTWLTSRSSCTAQAVSRAA
jgi:hypothetical protein